MGTFYFYFGSGAGGGHLMVFHWISIFVLFSGLWYWFKPFGTRLIGLTLLLTFPLVASATNIAVLEFELNDLTLNPNLVEEAERTATLRPLLVEQLSDHHGITVIANPPSARVEANKGQGYLFDRPALVAKIGREIGVDWIVSGRLHKASFLFVYLKAQLINTQTDQVAADFVVEIKGPQKKLTKKGIESLARQINAALETLGTE
jgi:TolB-like protein